MGRSYSRIIGFSLIELLVTLLIVAILLSIAWPSYQAQINKARRTEAMAALSGLAQAMERYAAHKHSYLGTSNSIGEPLIYHKQAPIDGANKWYNLRIINVTDHTYELQAQPIGTMKRDGVISVNSMNIKRWDKNASGEFEPNEQCWQQHC